MRIDKYNENTFNKVLKENDIVIVKFSAKWCGPCKKLQKDLEKNELNVLVLTVDVDDEQEFSENIKTLPTCVFYKNGKVVKSVSGNDLPKILEVHKSL